MPNFNVTLSAEWGPDDPEVESIWILFKEAIRKIDDEHMEDEADFRADRIYEKLNQARNHYKQIKDDAFSQRPTSEQATEYHNLYGALWSSYKDRLSKMAIALGYDIGAIFAGDNQYETQINALQNRYPEFNGIKASMDIQKARWQDVLRDNRNGHEHDGDFRNNQELPDLNNLNDAKIMFIHVTRSIENIGIMMISYKLPPYWNIITLNNRATVFDRTPRYELRHAMMGLNP
jgi:hypothetical protein